MKTVNVKTPTAEYPVIIGSGAIKVLPAKLRGMGLSEKVIVVSSPCIFGFYGGPLLKALKKAGTKNAGKVLFNDGEKNKTWGTCEKILEKLFVFEGDSMRRPAVVALGGGVVGDVSGFAAGIYKRGIPLINVPTTLLSMVDSSIGGKTGVDFTFRGNTVKNMLGTFYQPRLVIADIDFLKTLPSSEIKNGMAEVVKYGIIKDKNLFAFIEKKSRALLAAHPGPVAFVVERSAAIKAEVTGKDERETKGLRYILNLGHTVGHAVESASAFRYSHGNAISIGMACAADISVQLGMLKKSDAARISQLLIDLGLPVYFSGLDTRSIMQILRYDKKFTGGKNRFVLPVSIGSVRVVEGIGWDVIEKAVKNRATPRA